MCGILGVIGKRDLFEIKTISKRMSHRGPDESDYYQNEFGYIITHERLAIIDLNTGKQPIKGCTNAYVVHNGEIYNHRELREGLLKNHNFLTNCDSEVIVHLYEQFGDEFCNYLDGVFAFIILDQDSFIVGRDPIGVKPLYYGFDDKKNMYFSSELKCIDDQCSMLKEFPPGTVYTKEKGFVRFFKPKWENESNCTNKLDLNALRNSLVKATQKRLMSDVPIGVLLSGGLDSSIISSIVANTLKERNIRVQSFSIGLDKYSPDIVAARKVSKFLNTQHHEIFFTVEEGIECLDKLIWHLETYDVTSVRASAPMFFLSKYIKEQGIKVVLSGEGADEIFGGYLYFHNAPSSLEFQRETIKRVKRLSTADCLRADKSTMAHGVEVRVPFLDKDFLSLAMTIDPKYKQPSKKNGYIEKYILRKAFDIENSYLPKEVLWRQKEQFSDGVGYNWIDQLIRYCIKKVSNDELYFANRLFPINPPKTKEEYFIRKIFASHFPSEMAASSVKKWIPNWQENIDPSGRASHVHKKSISK